MDNMELQTLAGRLDRLEWLITHYIASKDREEALAIVDKLRMDIVWALGDRELRGQGR